MSLLFCNHWLYSRVMARRLHVVILNPVFQLVLEANDLLQLPDLPVRFMTDERAVKVNGEHNKNNSKWHHDAGGSNGCGLPRTYGAVARSLSSVEGEELDPAQEHHLCQEEEGPDNRGERPGQFDVAVHALMGRLIHRVEVVNIADGLQIREDAGADHESKEMHCYQNCGTGTESY